MIGSGGSYSTNQIYFACRKKRGGGTLPASVNYTGQRLDGSGLLYFNARFYDPVVGVFVSPDTLVPDTASVFSYNRYMYVQGRVLNMVDPSGHESSIPGWWPSYVPYIFDLPDSASYEGFVEWAGENNIPTSTSTQVGFSASGGFVVHGEASVELQFTFNWLSGEHMTSFNNSGGGRIGTPSNGIGVYGGGSLHYNAFSTSSIQDASVYTAVSGQADAFIKAGGNLGFARAVDYGDFNQNNQFDLYDNEGVRFNSPFIDPVFNAPVDSLSANLTGGFDLTPNAIDVGISGGVQDTNKILTIDVYYPIRMLSNLLSR